MEWRKLNELLKKKTKVVQLKKKAMAAIFVDCEGILLIDFKECNTTVNGTYHASLLHRFALPGSILPTLIWC